MTGKTSILSACILATTMWISSAAGCIPRHPAFSAPHLPRGLRPIAEPGHGNVAGSQRRALAAMLPPPGRRRAAHLGLRGSYGTYLTTLEKETKERQRGLRSLYEAEAAYDEGTIKVDKDHEIYYRVYGANKTSTKATALFLHGGPGAGCFPNHARFFDPEHYRVVLVDQRGCGRSTPRGMTQGNDLDSLVSDLEALRERLSLPRFDLVLGGSWGVTLAMAYAQRHPSRVAAMVLRGVCLFREREIAWLFAPTGGASVLNPRGYADFTASLTEEEIGAGLQGVLGAVARDLLGEDTTARDAAARRWSSWEGSMTAFARQFSGSGAGEAGVVEWDPTVAKWLVDGRPEEEVRAEFLSKLRRPSPASRNVTSSGAGPAAGSSSSSPGGNSSSAGSASWGSSTPAQAMLTCHFSLSPLPDDAILSRIDPVRHIPCVAVQGVSDLICPPGTAFDLHKAWPEMRLVLVNGAGHSMYEPGITSELVKATDYFRQLPP